MRFTNETSLTQLLKYNSQRLVRIMTVPINNGYRRLRRIFNPNGFTTRVMSDVRKKSTEVIAGKPQSLADYYSFGHYYIAKKLVILLVVAALILPVLYLKFLHPVVQAHLLTTELEINQPQMMGFTGKVKLYDHSGGTLLYQGPMTEGRITGKGTLYDYSGTLVYQGDFLMEQYEGKGQCFWPNGRVRYTGDFAANQYEGRGKAYSEDGSLLYDGDFAAGQYQGPGSLYRPSAKPPW